MDIFTNISYDIYSLLDIIKRVIYKLYQSKSATNEYLYALDTSNLKTVFTYFDKVTVISSYRELGVSEELNFCYNIGI